MKVRYRLVFCRSGVLRGDGRGLIQVEAAQGTKRMYFNSNVYLFPGQWDRRREMVVDYPNADALNAYLFEIVVNLERVELELWKRGVSPTLALIREHSRKSCTPLVSFNAFCEEVIRESARCESTKKCLMGTLCCLSSFRPGYSWDDVSHSFVQQFESWLFRKGFAKSTVVKHLRNLRTLVNEAVVAGYFRYDDNPFRTFRLVHSRSLHRFLSPDELYQMESLEVTGRQAHVRDAFLFCCYTGLRFSDFCLMRSSFFTREEGCLWLRMQQKKTGTEVVIPVSLLFDGKGEDILRRYDSVETFARLNSNSKVNACLKVLQGMAGVKTRLTFHVSRHTCATLLCHQGVPVTTVQKILGHTSVSTTQLYQEVMSQTIVNDLKKCINKL